MKPNIDYKHTFTYAVALLYIMLFTYAAVSKILDFENFQVQLGQSPLLSAFAGLVSYAVPTVELIICCLMLTSGWRLLGFYCAYSLMVMFTAYIFIILNYSSFIPCSCGGLLENLSWNQHIIFNMVFIILAVIGVLLSSPTKPKVSVRNKKKYAILFVGTFFSIGIIAYLFYLSERIIHYHNNFVRRYPHFPAVLDKEIDLKFDSYYFAGVSNDKIYMGNYTAPLQMLVFDGNLKNKKLYTISLDKVHLPFTSIQTKVIPPYFFLVDGNVPCIFRGNISDWRASYQMRGDLFFSQMEPIDSISLVYRTILKKTRTHTLGIMNLKDSATVKYESNLIQKQIDGLFDTDGLLHYDKKLKKLVYVYTYRNQYIVADSHLKLNYRGNTIDTISHAQLKVVTVKSNRETKLAAPPLIVNKTSALCENLLFVNSGLPGQFESPIMWKKSSIIDVYNIDNHAYMLSFYIYDSGMDRMRSFCVNGNKLFALIGNKLVSYKLRKSVTENYRKSNISKQQSIGQ